MSNIPSIIAARYKLRRDIALLFDSSRGIYRRLANSVALDMFDYAVRGLSAQEIVDSIVNDYDVPESTVANDVEEFFATLADDCIGNQEWYSVDKGFDQPLAFPLRIEMELTALCNWGCGFCYNVWKIDPSMSDAAARVAARSLPTKHMPTAMAKGLLAECNRNGCFVIRYSGGETMLHPEAMDIFRFGGQLGLYQVVFTNGHFITPDIAYEMATANVRTVLISLHGNADTQNALTGHQSAYDKSTHAIHCLVDAGIQVVVETTLVKQNISEILDIIRDVYTRGVREFRIMRYVGTGRNDDQYGISPNVILPLMSEVQCLIDTECKGMRIGWPCGQKFCTSDVDRPLLADDPTMALRFGQLTGHCESGMVWASVSYNGRLRNCPHSNVYFGEPGSSIQEAWNPLTHAVWSAVAPRDSCTGCSVRDLCRGGCHLNSFLEPPVSALNA